MTSDTDSSVVAHVVAHSLMDERIDRNKVQAELNRAHDVNIYLIESLREIKKSRWYRLGKFLRLVP